MHLYADESGNTGKELFHEPRFYHAGALLVVDQIEAVLQAKIASRVKLLGIERLHANEMKVQDVRETAWEIIETLDATTTWSLYFAEIEKPYVATTKFVDTVFDYGENKGARPLWYLHENFRHAICCVVDDLLTSRTRRKFWRAFIESDRAEFKLVLINVISRIQEVARDKRLREVLSDACYWAFEHPEELTLGGGTRSAYKTHTPNMIAFSVLMNAAHQFAEQHGVKGETFVHDEQNEFGGAMSNTYGMFSQIHWKESDWMAMPEVVRADLGKFQVVSSRILFSLQAVDLLLWIFRYSRDDALDSIKRKLEARTMMEVFRMSRWASEMTCAGWQMKLQNARMKDRDVRRGQKVIQRAEKRFKSELKQG